jgi:hypothetical protein
VLLVDSPLPLDDLLHLSSLSARPLLCLNHCRCEVFLPSSVFADPIHALCVVGRALWVCTGNNTNAGTVVIFDMDTATIKTKV